MEFLTKFFIFFVLFAGACSRSLEHDKNLSNNSEDGLGSSEDELENTSKEDFVSNSTESVRGETQKENLFNSTNSFTEKIPEENFTNSTDEADCNCNWRYFKHYETKGCFIEHFDSCGCPKKFYCPENQTLPSASNVCVYRHKEYQVGSKISTSNACQVCRCRNGDPPFMSCITKECPPLDPSPGENCHLVYRENSCCPIRFDCENAPQGEFFSNSTDSFRGETQEENLSNNTNVTEKISEENITNSTEVEIESEIEEEARQIQTCEYDGRLYPFGSKIYLENDPCRICICNENWKGVDNSSCYEHDCVFERNKPRLDAGCVPVYHENVCCPIEFYCPSSHNFSSLLLPNIETKNNEISDDNKCSFGDQLFDLGTEINMDNPCVTCSCVVPPDFTCIHRSCPPSPNEEHCYRVFNPTECCPSYECLMGDAQPESDAEGCPTPLCADSSCRIGTPAGHECPTCICGERVSELEHNDLQQQQQVQQIGQNMEPFHEMYEGPREIADDYSEDELQMMPIRIQDAEGYFPVMEKLILPESEDAELKPDDEIRELDDSSSEIDSYTEATTNSSEEALENIEQNLISMIESELDDLDVESSPNNTGKEVQKRSDITDAPGASQLEIDLPFEQQEFFGEAQPENGDIERESGYSESHGVYEDELESFKNKLFAKNDTIINEIISINHEVAVPEGCPTPMCEGPWCKVGIPEGHRCPTCICKRHIDIEP